MKRSVKKCKLETDYYGPFIILEVKPYDAFKIQLKGYPESESYIRHRNHLKLIPDATIFEKWV